MRQFQHFLYFYAAWAVGLTIWYLVTLKKAPVKKAEMIVKIIFFVVIGLNTIYGVMLDYSDATFLGVLLMIFYAIACPWGKAGYRKHPYGGNNSTDSESNESNTATTNLPWYKTWWVWLVIVATSVFISGVFLIMTDGSFRSSSISTDPFAESHKSSANTINVGYKSIRSRQSKLTELATLIRAGMVEQSKLIRLRSIKQLNHISMILLMMVSFK